MKKKLASLLLMLTLIVCQSPLIAIANDIPADTQGNTQQQEQQATEPEGQDLQTGQMPDTQLNDEGGAGNENGVAEGEEKADSEKAGDSAVDTENGGNDTDAVQDNSVTAPANDDNNKGTAAAKKLRTLGNTGADTNTVISSASIAVATPAAGSKAVNAKSIVSVPADANYSVSNAYWVIGTDSGGVTISSDSDHVYPDGLKAGENYALTVKLIANEGFVFKRGESTFTVTGTGASVNGSNEIFCRTGSDTDNQGGANILITPTSGTDTTANMKVYTPGHGTVKVDGVDKGTSFTGSWPEGTKVSAEAVPATGYKFSRWWIKHSSGNASLISTASTTLTAGTDLEAEAGFGLEKAPVTVTPPTAGSKGESTPPSVSVPAGAGYSVEESFWVGEGSALGSLILITPSTFEAGKTYYMYVKIHDGADSFSSGGAGGVFDTQLDVTGGTKQVQGTWSQQDGIVLEAIISVTIPETTQHTVSFDTDSHYATPSAQTVADGGKASRPAAPVYYAKASDYDTTGLRFHNWYTKPANQISSYWEFCYTPSTDSRGCIFDFNNKTITEDTTAYAVYEGVLTIKTYDVTNSQPDVGGKFDHRNYDSYSGSTDCTSGYQFTDFYNMPAFLKAKPAEGYVFVGWSTSTSKDDIISKDAEYEYTFMGRATLYALFEKENVTITFDAKGGTPVPDAQTFTAGGKATKPTDPTRDGWDFRGWYTDTAYTEESKFDFNTAVTKDTTLYAAWAKTLTLIPYDLTKKTSGGGAIAINGSTPATGVINVTHFDGTSDIAAAAPAEGYRFVGWNTSASRDNIVSTDAKYSLGTDDLYALFEEKPPVLTLHASSIDGDDFVEPIKIEVAKGTTISQALEQYKSGTSLDTELFKKDGYKDSKFRTNNVITDYTSEADLSGDSVSGETAINADKDIYYIMYKEIDKVSAGIESPVCGTETSNESGSVPYDQTNPPAVSVNAGNGYKLFTADSRPYAFWTENGTEMGPFAGNFKGDSTYYAKFKLLADFGYVFSALPTANLDNAEVTLVQVEDAVRPTNLMVGGAVKAVHDWGDWEVTKDPTETEEGLEERTCKTVDCGAYEERTIPKLVVEYRFVSGDGSSWTRGSTEKLNFVVKRNRADETTIEHFKGLKVDGKDVPSSGYTAKAGSVVIDLMPAYLGTLADGDHTLTAVFDDGNKETSASFKVLSAADKGSKDKANSNKKGSPATGDEAQLLIWLMILCTAGLALSERIIRRLKNDSADR